MHRKEPRLSRILRRLLLTVSLTVLMLMAASHWLLNTGSGARFILAYALPYADKLLPSHLHIQMRGIKAEALSNMHIRVLTLNDKNGPWLYVKNFSLRWNPMSLWHGGLEIDTLTADKLQFLRLPQVEESAPKALKDAIQSGIESITALPGQLEKLSLPSVVVKNFAIRSLEVSAAVLPVASFYTLSGNANLWHKPEHFSLTLDSVEGIASHAHLRFTHEQGAPRFALLWEEEAQGLLGQFLPLKSRDKGLSIESAQTVEKEVAQLSLLAHQEETPLLEATLQWKEQERIELYAQLPSPEVFNGIGKGTAPITAQSTITRNHMHLMLHTPLLNVQDAAYKDSLAEINIHLREEELPYLVKMTLRSTLPSGSIASAVLQSEGDGGLWNISGLNAALGAENTLTLSGDVSLTEETADLKGQVNTPDITANVQLEANDIFDNWEVAARAEIPTLALSLPHPFTPLLTLPLSVEINGTRDTSLSLALEGEHLTGEGEIFPNAMGDAPLASLTLTSQGMDNAYQLSAEHKTSQQGALRFQFNDGLLSVHYRIGEEQITVSNLSLISGKDAELKGQLAYHLNNQTITGEINGSLRGFATLAPLGIPSLPLDMLLGNVRLHLSPTKQGQNITATYKAGKTTLSGEPLLDNLSLSATLLLPRDKEASFTAKVDAEGLQQFLPLEMAVAEAKGTFSAIDFSLQGKNAITPTALSGKGAFKEDTLTLSAFSLQHRKHDYRITAPLRLELKENTITLPQLQLAVDKTGTIHGSAHLSPQSVKGGVEVKNIPLNAIPVEGFASLKGNLDGKATLSGKAENPLVDVTLTVEELQQNYPSLTRIREQPLSAKLTTHIANGTLKANLDAVVPAENSTVKADFTMPLALSLAPSAFSAQPGKTFTANLHADVVLGSFLPLFLPDGVYGTGHLITRLKASGSFQSPTITGELNLHSGHFELLQTVSSIRNLNFNAKANGKEIRITEGSATDGDKGRLTFNGTLKLTPTLPMDIAAQVKSFVLMRHHAATATVSGGATLKGDVRDAKLKGDWQVETARITITPTQSNKIPDIRVEEVASLDDPLTMPDFSAKTEAEQEKLREAWKAKRPFAHNLKLDVGIEAKNQIFLEGFGLNAELKGAVGISGTAARPKIGGNMETIRGRWEFFGKIFNIVRGRASLSENNLTAPMIDIEAQANANDVVAVATIKGTTDKPEITFSSIPSLPQDEILSRVMFGQRLNNISPYQAIQLADMIRTLKGGGSVNPLTQLQHSLGIDQLRINNGETAEDVTVGVGKYLTDSVYLEVEGGAGENAGKVSVEVDLTPRISVETEARQNADTAIRFNYKYDY